MRVDPLLAWAGIGLAALLTIVALSRSPRSFAHWIFAAGMVVLGGEAFLSFLSIEAVTLERFLSSQRWGLVVLAVAPAPWLLFSSVFARDHETQLGQKKLAIAIAGGLLPLSFALWFWNSLILGPIETDESHFLALKLGWPGFALHAWFLLGAVGVLMNLERTFRASVGTIRWRIKFLILGLVVFFVVRIYTSSQFLLYSGLRTTLTTVNLIALPIACLLMMRALARESVFSVTVYPSRAVLQHSLTALLAGLYLVTVGGLAKIVTALGGDTDFPLKAFFVLLALIGLTLLLVSDRVRQHARFFVSRHFKRPLYDHQKVWHVCTERTTSVMTETDLCRIVTRLTSETLQVLSVTVWLIDESRDRLVFAASTALTESSGQELAELGGGAAELSKAFGTHSYPVDIDESKEEWVVSLKRCNPEHFRQGGHRICVPLIAGGRLLGLITLGDRVSAIRLTVQDFDLLKCIGDQVAANLLNIQLSKRLLQAKEMEAFQTMSAFFVHDLKNTASTLSLMLKNLPMHFGDPAFREDALNAVGKSVDRINALINRMSLLRQRLDMNLKQTDLNEIVRSVLGGLEPAARGRVLTELSPVPEVSVDFEEFPKVITNLVLNAWDAVGQNGQGEVRIGTYRQDGWVVLSVSDNGCGMTPEFRTHSLFRPFQTTKKKGVGIGMFHTKAIVEAHHGKIEVTSNVGSGTTFRVLLPHPDKAA